MTFQHYYYSCESSILRDGRKTTTTTTITPGKPPVVEQTTTEASARSSAPPPPPPPPRNPFSDLFSSGPFSPVWQAWYDSPPPVTPKAASTSSSRQSASPPADNVKSHSLGMFDSFVATLPFAASAGISTDAKEEGAAGKRSEVKSPPPPSPSSPPSQPTATSLVDSDEDSKRPAKTTWLFAAAATALVTSTVLANLRARSARRDARIWRRDARKWQAMAMRTMEGGPQVNKAIQGASTAAALRTEPSTEPKPASIAAGSAPDASFDATAESTNAATEQAQSSPTRWSSTPYGPRVDPHTDFLIRIAPDPSLRGLYAPVHPHEDWNWTPADWPTPHRRRSAWHRNRPWLGSAGFSNTSEARAKLEEVWAASAQAASPRSDAHAAESIAEEHRQTFDESLSAAQRSDEALRHEVDAKIKPVGHSEKERRAAEVEEAQAASDEGVEAHRAAQQTLDEPAGEAQVVVEQAPILADEIDTTQSAFEMDKDRLAYDRIGDQVQAAWTTAQSDAAAVVHNGEAHVYEYQPTNPQPALTRKAEALRLYNVWLDVAAGEREDEDFCTHVALRLAESGQLDVAEDVLRYRLPPLPEASRDKSDQQIEPRTWRHEALGYIEVGEFDEAIERMRAQRAYLAGRARLAAVVLADLDKEDVEQATWTLEALQFESGTDWVPPILDLLQRGDVLRARKRLYDHVRKEEKQFVSRVLRTGLGPDENGKALSHNDKGAKASKDNGEEQGRVEEEGSTGEEKHQSQSLNSAPSETNATADAAAPAPASTVYQDAEAALQAERERVEVLERQMLAMQARLTDRDAMLAEREARLSIETARLRAPPLGDDRLKMLEEEVRALQRKLHHRNDGEDDGHGAARHFRVWRRW